MQLGDAGRLVPLKPLADEAMELCPDITRCIVVRRAGTGVPMTPGRDLWWHQEMKAADIKNTCEPEQMDAEARTFATALGRVAANLGAKPAGPAA